MKMKMKISMVLMTKIQNKEFIMVQVKTGEFAGKIGTFFLDNEMISVFDDVSQTWYVVPASVGYDILCCLFMNLGHLALVQ